MGCPAGAKDLEAYTAFHFSAQFERRTNPEGPVSLLFVVFLVPNDRCRIYLEALLDSSMAFSHTEIVQRRSNIR